MHFNLSRTTKVVKPNIDGKGGGKGGSNDRWKGTTYANPPPTKIEKVVAMVFPELVNAGSNNSNSDDNSSQCSFESLFNGSTYYIDEYFNSIGFDGSTTDCHSTISGLSGASLFAGKSNDDVESVYTTSSSSSSTLEGLKISHNESSPTATEHSNTLATVASTLEKSSTPKHDKTTGIPSSWSSLLRGMLLLEKIFIMVLLFAIITGCVITTLTVIRHVHTKNISTSSVQGIISTSNQTAISTTTVISVTNHSNESENRLHQIRLWLGDDFNPPPGMPQYDALVWLAYDDMPTILGTDLQPRLPRNDTNQAESIRWNSNLSTRITQRYVLLLLFFANIGTEDLMLGGWGSLTGARLIECIWPGVTCRTSPDGISVVTGVEMNPNIGHLHGSIPAEIGLLSNLGTYLNLGRSFWSAALLLSLFDCNPFHVQRLLFSWTIYSRLTYRLNCIL
jgi:hypothetical protein